MIESLEAIPEIRVLPMSKSEFSTLDNCLEFLKQIVPNRGYIFFYKKHNLCTFPGSLILFQYSGQIIGYCIFETEKKLDHKKDGIQIELGYTGCYVFKKNSINILNKFITRNEFYNNFKIYLNQGTARVSKKYIDRLIYLLDRKE